MSTDDVSESHRFSLEEIEKIFVDEHWNYGVAIHEKSAEALYAALGDPSEANTGHPFFTRLYGEYAGSLETFGATRSPRSRSRSSSSRRRTTTRPATRC
jgi:hypothetical protein